MKVLSWSALVTLIATATAFQCKDERVINTTTIGAAGEVTIELVACNMTEMYDLTSKRQTYSACETSCNTNCFVPAGPGPKLSDCLGLAKTMQLPLTNGNAFGPNPLPAGAMSRWIYGSCSSTLTNLLADSYLSFCYSYWAQVIIQMSSTCQSQLNVASGNCFPNAGSGWFIGVDPLQL